MMGNVLTLTKNIDNIKLLFQVNVSLYSMQENNFTKFLMTE